MNKEDFGEVMREMIKNEAEGAFEKELTDEQLEYAFERCMEDIHCLIQENLSQIEIEEDIEERNKDAKTALPRYSLYVTYLYKENKDWELTGSYTNKEDAEAYFRCFAGWYSYEDRKITLVDENGEKDLEDITKQQHEEHKNCNHKNGKEDCFPF